MPGAIADGQVEITGQLSPAGVNAVLVAKSSGWGFTQLVTEAGCANGQVMQPTKNQPDGPPDREPVGVSWGG